ncbi:MAG: proteasome assembly chaperone 4 [Candidatus Hermodarchaeia archaeon]
MLTEEIEDRGIHFSAKLLKLENSVLVFFNEKGSFNLGTLAIATPTPPSSTPLSSILLGERNMNLTRILAGRFSKAFGCISLVSTHLVHLNERETSSLLLKLAQKLIDKSL